MSDLTWLTVGGCPRSGTTALGETLNLHPEVILFHEYDQAHFFNTVRALFREEDRLSVYDETDQFDLIPRRAKHGAGIVRGIFQAVSGKSATILGTKFPGAHLWPEPEMIEGVTRKQIHITRAPHAVVASYAKKMLREGCSDGVAHVLDTAIAHWISAWNYAIDHRDDPSFLHLFYEEIASNPATANEIAMFLGLDDASAFDFSGFRSTNKTAAEYRAELEAMGFGAPLGRLDALARYAQWADFARDAMRDGTKIGFPLASGDLIDLSALHGANGWKYPVQGFYPPEADGRWINGKEAALHIIPQFDAQLAQLSIDVPWTFEPEGIPPVLSVEVDGQRVLDTQVSLGNTQGVSKRFTWLLRDINLRAGCSSVIRLRILNPRNPKSLGLGQDDRDLGLMIRGLRIDPL